MKNFLAYVVKFALIIGFTNLVLAEGNVAVDKTMTAKVYVGYQGWFNAKGDGMKANFRHYGGGRNSAFNVTSATIDMWPDLREYAQSERYKTDFINADGSVAEVFSSAHPDTVNRHFKWMSEYNIDGAFLQRFASTTKPSRGYKKNLDKVLQNVRIASIKNKVGWALMYDLSGLRKGEIDSVLIADLKNLLSHGITNDPYYIHHNGKPLISVWGGGFQDRKYTLSEIDKLIKFLKSPHKNSPNGHAVMLGVPHKWRTLGSDTTGDAMLLSLIKQADIVSPWSVGRYKKIAEVERLVETQLIPDIEWLDKQNIDYLPVIYPGFSWHNLYSTRGIKAKLNQIPRLGGKFLWSQAVAAKRSGARMVYIAMFDEVDEGTAIFKVTNHPPVKDIKSQKAKFIGYEGLPSDHYLWLASKIKQLLGETDEQFAFPDLRE